MDIIKGESYKELINKNGGQVISIDLSAPSNFLNPLDIPHTEDIDHHLSEHIIPMINSIAENLKDFTLTEFEKGAIKKIVVEMHENQEDLNFLTFRNAMIEKTSDNYDLTRLIELLNISL